MCEITCLHAFLFLTQVALAGPGIISELEGSWDASYPPEI